MNLFLRVATASPAFSHNTKLQIKHEVNSKFRIQDLFFLHKNFHHSNVFLRDYTLAFLIQWTKSLKFVCERPPRTLSITLA